MNDPYRRENPAPGGPTQDQDPLAELARLIGRNEGDAEFGRGGHQRGGAPTDPRFAVSRAPARHAEWPPQPDYSADEASRLATASPPARRAEWPPQPDYTSEEVSRLGAASHPPRHVEWPPQPDHSAGEISRALSTPQGFTSPPPHRDPAPSYPAPGKPQGQVSESQVSGHPHQGYTSQTYTHPTPDYRGPVARLDQGFQPQVPGHREPQADPSADHYHSSQDASGYAAAQDLHGYQPDPYPQNDGQGPAPDEEIYDDAPRPRSRSTLLIVAALLSLAVVGTAGAFAYRSFFGTGSGTATPPVIKADTAPSKVVPAVQASDAQTNKLIQDRLGSAPQGERIVSREEQPIELREQRPAAPRAVFPPVAASADTSANVASASQNPPGLSSVNEPKKVRTVIIRPDQPDVVVRDQMPEPPRSTTSAPPPRAAQPRPTPPSAPAAQPTRSANGPLSLSPQTSNPPQRQQPVPLAPSAQLASAAPVTAGAGSYLVQVSSQRSEADAQASFRSLQSRFPSQLGSRSAIIRRADLGEKGIYYRSMVGPFPSSEDAVQFCNGLKAAGGQCLIQRN